MTIERRPARAGFTLTRDYPVALERVWNAFAKEDQKLEWFGAGVVEVLRGRGDLLDRFASTFHLGA